MLFQNCILFHSSKILAEQYIWFVFSVIKPKYLSWLGQRKVFICCLSNILLPMQSFVTYSIFSCPSNILLKIQYFVAKAIFFSACGGGEAYHSAGHEMLPIVSITPHRASRALRFCGYLKRTFALIAIT